MTDQTILLIPEDDEDQDRLLSPGLCGAGVPGMYLGAQSSGWVRCRAGGGPRPRALVLAYRGKVIGEGMTRATQILGEKKGLRGDLFFCKRKEGWELSVIYPQDLRDGNDQETTSIVYSMGAKEDDRSDPKRWVRSAPYLEVTPNLIPSLERAWVLAKICSEELTNSRVATLRLGGVTDPP